MIITLVGIDGCGKSTCASAVMACLKVAGRDPVSVEDPGSTVLGNEVRRIVFGQNMALGHTTETLLFFAARAEAYGNIVLPALAAGRDVVLCRWWFCTYAYQGASGVSKKWIRELSETVCPLDPKETVAMWLDVDPEKARERILHRSQGKDLDRFDALDMDTVIKVRGNYEELCSEGYLVRIDANGDSEETLGQIRPLVIGRLGRRPRP